MSTSRARSDLERLELLVHEVRSPVAALAAIAETFTVESVGRDERHELAALALAACRSIERILTDAAYASVRLERTDVGRLVRETVASAALGGAPVRARVDTDLPLVPADPQRVRQVLDNLIRNALVHGDHEGEILVQAHLGGRHAFVVSVSNAGPAIVAEDRDRIFEQRARLTSEGEGAGLGLWLSRAIARAHGGALGVESFGETGTTFTLTLPLGPQPATERASS